MGSSSSATPRNGNEKPHGIWPNYTWTTEEFAWHIQQGIVSPCFPPIADENRRDLVYCEICYQGFPVINECGCCNQTICTECLAAVVKKDQMAKRRCPFCKTDVFGIRPNVDKPHLKNKPFNPEAAEPEALDWDDSLPEEINLAIISYPNISKDIKDDLIRMYRNGELTAADCAANFIAIGGI